MEESSGGVEGRGGRAVGSAKGEEGVDGGGGEIGKDEGGGAGGIDLQREKCGVSPAPTLLVHVSVPTCFSTSRLSTSPTITSKTSLPSG